MSTAGWAVAVALLLGSVRALQLWRSAARVDVVNVVVVGALVQGRGSDLTAVLANAGSGLYIGVARAIAQPIDKLRSGEQAELRSRLERDARVALARVNQRLGRLAWLDSVAVVAIGLSGVSALVGERPSMITTLGLIAATLLWLSNVRGARSIATQAHSGALALVDALLASIEEIRASAVPDATEK